MVQICIQNLGNRRIDSTDTSRKVIEIIHESGKDWMHACGKKGRCTTCKLIVVAGMENLSELTDREKVFLNQGRIKSEERLACQTVLEAGSLHVRVAEQNKFPHLNYSE